MLLTNAQSFHARTFSSVCLMITLVLYSITYSNSTLKPSVLMIHAMIYALWLNHVLTWNLSKSRSLVGQGPCERCHRWSWAQSHPHRTCCPLSKSHILRPQFHPSSPIAPSFVSHSSIASALMGQTKKQSRLLHGSIPFKISYSTHTLC